MSQLDAELVDSYKTAKLREGRLGAAQINKTLTRLSQILEDAVDYGHLQSNPARGSRRRVKAPETQRAYVEPEQLMALLDAADTLRNSAEVRPVLATLAGAGLRIGEACSLEWRDVNLPTGTLRRP